jgi:hypothetical protein
LAKVIAELSSSPYQPRMTVVGSRHQLCIHPAVQTAKPSAKNGMCRTLVSKGKCRYHEGVQEHVASTPHAATVTDIEDLVRKKKKKKGNTYFAFF